MVELDFYDYLKADSILRGLLGVTVGESKIYPLQAPQTAEMPYIIYSVNDKGGLDETLLNCNLQFNCISDNYAESAEIKDRVNELLNIENRIIDAIRDGYMRYYFCKLSGSFNYKDPNLDVFYNIANYDITYLDVYGFLLQENEFKILQENGYGIRV